MAECFTIATITWLTVTEYMCHKWLNICATNDWIYVPQMTEYMCLKWLNICATNDWIYVPQMTEYMCHKWLNICATNDNRYVPFDGIAILFFPHSWLITGWTRITRRVPLVEQELLTHGREFTPMFQWGSCCPLFSFLYSILSTIICSLVLFLLTIVLAVLRITICD
jgi:hypothetical protein